MCNEGITALELWGAFTLIGCISMFIVFYILAHSHMRGHKGEN